MTQEKNEEINYHRKIFKSGGRELNKNIFFKTFKQQVFSKKNIQLFKLFAFFFFRAELEKVIMDQNIHNLIKNTSMEDHAWT